jgi:hypothetical protein
VSFNISANFEIAVRPWVRPRETSISESLSAVFACVGREPLPVVVIVHEMSGLCRMSSSAFRCRCTVNLETTSLAGILSIASFLLPGIASLLCGDQCCIVRIEPYKYHRTRSRVACSHYIASVALNGSQTLC